MRPVNPQVVVDRVAEWHWLKTADILGGGQRATHVARARHQAVHLLQEMCGMSFTSARRFMGLNPSGTGARRVPAGVEDDLPELAQFVREASA